MITFDQGLVVDGGGERKGMAGIVVGMVGNEGIVVGRLGSEAADSGGNVTFGMVVGMVGKVGIWVLGKGGNAVGIGRVVGNGGTVILGMVGNVGNGGSVTLGMGGIVCRRWRVAMVIWMPERASAVSRERSRPPWKADIFFLR
ncbi:hypothetical protein U1Q18_048012 [Sarracenia purpurea var. burkii]